MTRTDAPPPALGELARRATQLRAFAREHLHGGCKVLSLGADCPCNLCAVDALVALASGGAAGGLQQESDTEQDERELLARANRSRGAKDGWEIRRRRERGDL